MKRKIFSTFIYVFFFLVIPVTIHTQELLIVYDHENKSLKYLLDDEEIDRPVAKAGQSIIIEIKNFNNYLYDIKVEETFTAKKIGSGNAILSNLTKIGSSNPGDLAGNGMPWNSEMPKFDLTDSDGDGIIDMLDQEIDSPAGFAVDTRGVTLDSDKDGIPDSKDDEPFSRPGSVVNGRGVALIADPGYLTEEDLNILLDSKAAAIIPATELMSAEDFLKIEEAKRKENLINEYLGKMESGLRELSKLEENIDKEKTEIWKIVRSNELMESAPQLVQEIIYNPLLPVTSIKEQCIAMVRHILDLKDSEKLSLQSLEAKYDKKEFLMEKLLKNNQDRKAYEDKLNSLEPIALQLNQLDPERSEVLNSHLKRKQSLSSSFYTASQALSDTLESKIEEFKSQDPGLVRDLWIQLEEIKNHSFNHTHRSFADKDEVVYNITLTSKQGVPDNGFSNKIELKPITVPIYGGLKINTSVGVNFAQFLDPVKSYYIKNDQIVSQDGDQFIPFITSFVHFYQQGRKSISVGGSLGFGIPIGGGSGLESASFFLGPSMFMGNSNRIILNLGLMGGKVERLGGGLREGDSLSNGQTFIPIQSNYNIGLFFGISFNLGR